MDLGMANTHYEFRDGNRRAISLEPGGRGNAAGYWVFGSARTSNLRVYRDEDGGAWGGASAETRAVGSLGALLRRNGKPHSIEWSSFYGAPGRAHSIGDSGPSHGR